MVFQIFLHADNRFDLGVDSFLIEGFAVLEMSQMPSDANNFDVSFSQPPKLILFQNVNVFLNALP